MNSQFTRADGFIRSLLCAGALACMPSMAQAYLDPGAGSLIFQSLLAVLFGVGVAWRKIREAVAHVWRRLFARQSTDDGV